MVLYKRFGSIFVNISNIMFYKCPIIQKTEKIVLYLDIRFGDYDVS